MSLISDSWRVPRAYPPAMSDVSPGPGWWKASDGKWYPQKWEYQFVDYEAEGVSLKVSWTGSGSL